MKQIAILIPTLPVRIEKYCKLIKEINRQVIEHDLCDKIQIVTFGDTKDYVVGHKRNVLLGMSLAKYICFIDDDDFISPKYVIQLYNASLKDVDCVSFNGVFVSQGTERLIDMSKSHRGDIDENNCYYRLPNHLSCVKREIALKCKFPLLQFGEDNEYSKRIKKYIKTEHKIKDILYFYNYDKRTSQTNPNGSSNQFKEY